MAALAPTRQPISSLRRGLYQAVSDPDLAERVLTLALASRNPGAKVVVPWSEAKVPELPMPQSAESAYVAHLAHDLCLLLAFVPAKEAGRAELLAGIRLWRVVRHLGGWRALCAVPRHLRRRHIVSGLAHLTAPGRLLACVPPLAPLRAATHTRAHESLERYQQSFPALLALDVFDLIAQPLTLGAIDFLLARLAAASENWAPGRVRQSWYILAAKCPTASGG